MCKEEKKLFCNIPSKGLQRTQIKIYAYMVDVHDFSSVLFSYI